MNQRPPWAPDEIDIERPSVARMYDFFLGGSNNFAADRRLALEYLQVLPDMPAIARAQRAVLHRVVRYLAAAGVDQFLDLGSGMPTAGTVHETAQRVNPRARVVYVDVDPVAAAHGRALLGRTPHTGVVLADLRDPAYVLKHPVTAELFDFSRPIALLMIAVLHFLPDRDEPAEVVGRYRDASAPGSAIAITHATNDYDPEMAERAEAVYRKASHQMHYRSRSEVEALLAGYDLAEPGLVDMTCWRPDGRPSPDPLGGDVTRYSGYAAVGRKNA
ncbi:SAM-dependent methyltransferase [Actinospica robiniae]|uniref:SAM-dependent methyltransferase n=1 Tax=Actinospica robiniae TaxID=304901 RepID=UPI0004113283|nr:SAM-dependent methyltransferase [Actinospica robiniae]